jgi:hypothetical protein
MVRGERATVASTSSRHLKSAWRINVHRSGRAALMADDQRAATRSFFFVCGRIRDGSRVLEIACGCARLFTADR